MDSSENYIVLTALCRQYTICNTCLKYISVKWFNWCSRLLHVQGSLNITYAFIINPQFHFIQGNTNNWWNIVLTIVWKTMNHLLFHFGKDYLKITTTNVVLSQLYINTIKMRSLQLIISNKNIYNASNNTHIHAS